MYEVYDELDSPELEYPPMKTSIGNTSQQSGSVGSYCSSASEGKASSVSIGPDRVGLSYCRSASQGKASSMSIGPDRVGLSYCSSASEGKASSVSIGPGRVGLS